MLTDKLTWLLRYISYVLVQCTFDMATCHVFRIYANKVNQQFMTHLLSQEYAYAAMSDLLSDWSNTSKAIWQFSAGHLIRHEFMALLSQAYHAYNLSPLWGYKLLMDPLIFLLFQVVQWIDLVDPPLLLLNGEDRQILRLWVIGWVDRINPGSWIMC